MLIELAKESAAISSEMREQIRVLAQQLSSTSVLPLIGAGASLDCGSPSAGALASRLAYKIDNGDIAISNAPSDYEEVREDIGKLADLICLEYSPDRVLEEIGFMDIGQWPSADSVVNAYESADHPCPYRVLARMARERFISESVTFNYDCHYEGGLKKEGSFPQDRVMRHGRWPELFTVIADAATHSSVLTRGEFVLNKVHGCVETWRQAREKDRELATGAIVIRWSQLLDWREDWWSRDLVRDRARRNILLVIGFSVLDPAIHSTLQAVMREVVPETESGPARIRVMDPRPNQLSLQLLAKAGKGEENDVTAIPVPLDDSVSLAAILLTLLTELIRARLIEHANVYGVEPCLPTSPEALASRLAVSGPAMLRWTWSILAKTEYGPHGLASISEKRDDYYVPLTAEPERTRLAFRLRDQIAEQFSIPAEDSRQDLEGSFLLVASRGCAYMPLGLHEHEIAALCRRGILKDVANELRAPEGLERLVVAHSQGKPVGYSVDTGQEVRL